MVILNSAMGGRLSTKRLSTITGIGSAGLTDFLVSMREHGLVVCKRVTNRKEWITTPKGRELAKDIEELLKRAGIEMRET